MPATGFKMGPKTRLMTREAEMKPKVKELCHARTEFMADHEDALWQSRKTNQIHKQATGLRTDREREIDNCCLVALTKLFTDPIRMRIPERNLSSPPSFCCCALIANLAHALATATNTINRLLFFYVFIYLLFVY